MTLLYCSPNVLSFIRFRRDTHLLQPELEIHSAGGTEAVKGWNRKQTHFVRGEKYDELPADMRKLVENNYKEYVASN